MTEQPTTSPASSQPATPPPSGGAPEADLAKILAIVGYLVPILFFVPLIVESTKANSASRFHASQQLNLLILMLLLQVIAIVPVLGWLVAFFGWILAVVLIIIGVINAAQGKMKPLPIIGSYQLIK